MYKILISCLLLFLISCGDDDSNQSNIDAVYASSSEDIAASNPTLKISKESFDSLDNNRKNGITEGDDFIFGSVTRNNDILEVEVTYSGGCKIHTFEVIWDGIIYTDDPCHANLIFLHDAHEDKCEVSITKTLYINLKDLIGNIEYKDICEYYLYNTFNSSNTPDIKFVN